jgi:hypothetical protein
MTSTARYLRWVGAGALIGVLAGVAWGWFGSGGYEAGDSALGTGFLCGLVGAMVGAVVRSALDRRDRHRRRGT